MELRHLRRDEQDLIWTIDRREVRDAVYVVRDGELQRIEQRRVFDGWPEGVREVATPWLQACFDRGGLFLAMFDGGSLVGVAVLDTLPRGPRGDWLQLSKLFISRDCRGSGVGGQLFDEVVRAALERGANYLYISSSPTANTVEFYLRRGSKLAVPPDPELFAEEPDDIHLLCPIPLRNAVANPDGLR